MRISDWSSDVCSSDLLCRQFRRQGRLEQAPLVEQFIKQQGKAGDLLGNPRARRAQRQQTSQRTGIDRKSVVSGKSVSVRGDLGGRRSIKKKKKIVMYKSYHNKKL